MAADDESAVSQNRTKRTRKKKNDAEDVLLSPSDEPKSKAKSNIRDILKKAVDENNEDEMELKKSKKGTKMGKSKVLERIKSGEDLLKDQDDTVESNTYNPEEKNVRSKKDKSRKGIENPVYDDTGDKPVATKRTNKKSNQNDSTVDETESEIRDNPLTIDELATTSGKSKKSKRKKETSSAAETTVKSEEEEEPKKKDKKKEKKRKKTKEESATEDDAKQTAEETETKENPTPKKRKKKGKDKDAAEKSGDEIEATPQEPSDPSAAATDPAAAETAETAEGPDPRSDDGRVLGITIHRTDKLKSDLSVSHPLVKVSVIDSETGSYLKKQTLNRAVTSYFESQKKIDNIFPIMTQPFDYRAKRSVIPDWNEMVLFNENYNYFTADKPSVILFFELIDFVSMNQASVKYSRAKEDGGWHRIAWAFLKIRGANGKLNTDKRTRLQLYFCPARFKPLDGKPDVYTWWKLYPRDHYPSTLYVTIKGIVTPKSLQPAARSLVATQPELGTTTYKELRKSLRTSREGLLTKKSSPSSWGRLPGQMCKIPNSLTLTLSAGRKGCYIVKFSHDGRLLACGCHDKNDYIIMLYEIPSGQLKIQYTGHYGLIYDLCWSYDDSMIISGSGDGTARVWDVDTMEDVTDKLMPHPAFVYSAKFHPRTSSIVVTGGFDSVIRVWDIAVAGHNGQLMQEIDYHEGHVNSLSFDSEGGKLFSADSMGVINIWDVFVTTQPNRPAFLRDWSLFQEIRDEEFRNIPISEITVFYGDRRLLVQTRDNTLRLIDLRVFSVMQRYLGCLNFREHLHSTVTPCGTFVMAGSEDNVAYVWNTETGDQVAMYDEFNYGSAVTDVEYHPHEHMAAFCSYGENHPVLVYGFDSKKAKQTQASTGAAVTSKPPMKQKLEDPLATRKSDQQMNFTSYDSTRYSKVLQKLGTVASANTAFRDQLKSQDLGGRPGMDSWGMLGGTFDQSLSTRGQAWRPEFSRVGRMGNTVDSARQVSMQLSDTEGRAEFTFQSKQPKDELPKCFVLYDYKAARSDELDMVAGDTVTLLYKDNDNWWMGEIKGRQGYFPSNYVEEQRPEDELEALSASSDDEEKRKVAEEMKSLASKRRGSVGSLGSNSGRSAARMRRDSLNSTTSQTGRSSTRIRRNSRQTESTA